MKLEAFISTTYNGTPCAVIREISIRPNKLIEQINHFSNAIKDCIKNQIFDDIATQGTIPRDISIRMFCGDLILDFHRNITFPLDSNTSWNINKILYELSDEYTRELVFNIACDIEFRAQRKKR